MSSGPPRVRLREVAGAAGVSISTASRVLGGKANVSPASRRAVLAASRRLNYRGDPIARALRTQRSGIVGMLVPNIGNPLFAALIQAAARTLETTNVDLMLADSHGSVRREEHWLVGLRERRVDGLLVIPVHHRDSRPALAEAAAAVPVVQIDRRVDEVAADFVAVDDTLGLSLVVDHLVGQGVERVAMISDSEATPLGRARLAAFNTAVTAHPAVQVTARMLGEFSTAFGRDAVRTLAARRAIPEAIVCGSDMIALGALAELRDQGLGVPGDVLIVGFDGVIPAELTEPALTTVAQPLDAIAIEAGRLLELRIAGSHAPPQRSELAPELLVRVSSRRQRPAGVPWRQAMITIHPETDAVLAVDTQKGFMPGDEAGYGELPAPEGHAVAGPLGALADRVRIYAATGDAHTADHSSFTAHGGIWPEHCVAGTPGAELHPHVAAALTPGWFFAKGTTREADAYSAFAVTDLAERLRGAGVQRLIIGGLVTNVCVLATTLDALNAGFEVIVLADACRAVDAEDLPSGEEALAQMRDAGATITTSDELAVGSPGPLAGGGRR